MSKDRVRFGAVHIMESLDTGFAGRTGHHLHEELLPIGLSAQPRMEIHYHRVDTAAAFLSTLDEIRDESITANRVPLLHFETHGSGDGLSLASGELLTWQQLKPPLTILNQISNLNLVVVVAACDGLDLVKILEVTDRAPVRLVIGPSRPLKNRELELGCLAFYKTMFETRNGGAAHQAMNDALLSLGITDRPFHAITAEEMFRTVLTGFFNEYCEPERLTSRVDAMLVKINHNALADRGSELSEHEAAEARNKLWGSMMEFRQRFDEFFAKFFLVDIDVANRARFHIPFEECWRPTAPRT